MENKHIKPLIGVGKVQFGFNRNQVKKIVGEPTEIDTFQYEEEEEDELTESWHYDDHEMSFSFDETEDWKLVNIAVSSESFTLNGKSIIGSSKEEVIQIIEDMDMGNYVEDDENGVVAVLDAQINFWFDDDEVAEIQWNVDWNEEGEAIFPK